MEDNEPKFTTDEVVAINVAILTLKNSPTTPGGTAFTPEFFRILEQAAEKFKLEQPIEATIDQYKDRWLEEAPSMEKLHEDDEQIIFMGEFKGHPVRYHFDKQTQDVRINSDDVAKVLGYKNEQELLGSDEGLDAISAYMKTHPEQEGIKLIDIANQMKVVARNWTNDPLDLTLSARERAHLNTILIRYREMMIDGTDIEDLDDVLDGESKPGLPTEVVNADLWAIFKKLNQKPA